MKLQSEAHLISRARFLSLLIFSRLEYCYEITTSPPTGSHYLYKVGANWHRLPRKNPILWRRKDMFSPVNGWSPKTFGEARRIEEKTCTHSWTRVRGFGSNGGIPRPPSTCDLSRPRFSIVGHLPYSRNAQHLRFVILLGLRTKTKCFEGRACRTKCATGSTYKKRFWYGTVREFGETEELVQYVYT